MDGRNPRVELVPWDFDSEEHQARMYLQRLACGWRSEEVQRWAEQGRAATKTLYWIVCYFLSFFLSFCKGCPELKRIGRFANSHKTQGAPG